MLKLFNSLGKRIEPFRPVNRNVVNIFTCGPSMYQRAHIGNFRTFLFEDILVRYLEYSGYRVRRGMNFTDIEDKALIEAHKKHVRLADLTSKNIRTFLDEMRALKIKIPDYLPRASEHVDDAVRIIEKLLEKKIAYRCGDNIYFEPLKFKGFGKLYGLDMKRWPSKKVRFHKDTYPGMRWNLGDFIIWHGCRSFDRVCWDSPVGKGWPGWNIQDPSMVFSYIDEPLTIYCGGIDNLVRHHDYSVAILESVRRYPMARYWLHGNHLYVNGKKMSKSLGNIIYTDMLLRRGYTMEEIRFFLIYGHYRKRLNYSVKLMRKKVNHLRALRERIRKIGKKARGNPDTKSKTAMQIRAIFAEHMDNNLDVRGAFDGIEAVLNKISPGLLKASEVSAIMRAVRSIDSVLRIFC